MSEAALTFDAPPLTVSYPAQLDMHMIFDTELEMLRLAGRDHSLEIALATGGAGVGLLQNLLKAGYAILVTKTAADPLDFVLGVACAVFLAASFSYFRNSIGIGSRIDKLVKEIRDRPKKGGVIEAAT
jgi:hypothetical protein